MKKSELIQKLQEIPGDPEVNFLIEDADNVNYMFPILEIKKGYNNVRKDNYDFVTLFFKEVLKGLS